VLPSATVYGGVGAKRNALRDFWVVYDAQQARMRMALLDVASKTPAVQGLIEALFFEPQASADLSAQLKRACFEGEWEGYDEGLRKRGALYSKQRVPLSVVYDIVCVTRDVLTPALVMQYASDPPRLARALAVVNELFDRTMTAVTDEYTRGRTTDASKDAEELEELEQRVSDGTDALRASEEQLRQSQKMDAIGRLAGGIAHDFNNLLSVILSYGEMLSTELPEDNELHSEVGEIRRAARRAADLTRQLLAFSRQQVLAPRVTDLNQVLTNMDKMLSRIIGEHIELLTRTTPDLAMVLVDPNQIEQVVMNLVVNARDAMPGGGALTLETANIELDDAYAAEHPGVTAGPHVMIAVRDSGIGIDAATRARIFEPFFTTKATGKGTGLGLSTVFGIVNQSGGHIWVDSEEGKGTSFKIYFPRAKHEQKQSAKIPRVLPPKGTETILIVEDEEQVRTLTKTVLKRLGYEVLEADSPTSALVLANKHEGKIDLLLTDVVMPKMSGRELAERLMGSRPKMKVLFMSGYTDDAIVHHGVLESDTSFLQKPITPDALAHKVRDVFAEGN